MRGATPTTSWRGGTPSLGRADKYARGVAGPIEQTYVEVLPDLTRFDRELQSGLNSAFAKAEQAASSAAEGIEDEFTQGAIDAERAIDRNLGGDAFQKVELAAGQAGQEIEAEFKEAANAAERALDGIEPDTSGFGDAGKSGGDSFLGGLDVTMLAKGGVAAIGVAAAAALAAGFEGAMAAEDLGARLQGQLGISEENAARAGQTAANLYRDAWGDSLDEVGEAVTALLGNFPDLTDAELEAAGAEVLAFADLFNIDVAEAAAAAGIAVENDLATSATGALDLLTKSFQEVPPLIRDEITTAISEYGKSFDQLGIEGPEAFGLLVQASDQGIIGIDKAGDAIKEFTIRATDGSKLSSEAFDTIGLDAEAMANDILAGGDTAGDAFGQIVEGLLGITDPAEQANTAIALFGTPIEDLGTENIPAFLEALSGGEGALTDFEGAAQEAADTVGGTTSAQIESFKREVLGGLADFTGAVLIPALQGLVDFFQLIIPPAVELVRTAVSGLVAWWEENWPRIQAAMQPLIDWVTLTLWPALQEVWGFIQAEVGALLLWWEENWPLFQETIQGVWEAIVVLIEDAWARIELIISVALEIITVIWNTWGETIVEYLASTWENVKSIVQAAIEIVRGIIDTVTALIRGDWSAVWDGIKTILSGVWNLMKGIVSQAINQLKTIIRIPLDAIKALWSAAWNGIKSTLSSIWETMKTNVSNSIDTVIGFFRGIPGAISSAFSTLSEAILAPFRWAFDQIRSLWNSTAGGFGFSIPSWVPGVGGREFRIPEMEYGGFVNAPTIAMLGERSKQELVLPLTNKARTRDLLGQAGLWPPGGEGERSGAQVAFYGGQVFQDATDADLASQRVTAALDARRLTAA